MSKRNKTIAKIHSELKAKENSLKNKIKNTADDLLKSELENELYEIQFTLLRGAPFPLRMKDIK